MTALALHAEEYLAVRRGLGFKLENEQRMLTGFIAFMDDAGGSTVTVGLALRWATMPRSRRCSCCPRGGTDRPRTSTATRRSPR